MSRKPAQFDGHPVPYDQALTSGRFRGFGEHVVDGDTYDVLLDLGFYQYAYERIRLADVDTPEIYGVSHDSEEYARGLEASNFVRPYVAKRPILVNTREEESFGRFVGDVWVLGEDDTWQNLASMLRGEGHA